MRRVGNGWPLRPWKVAVGRGGDAPVARLAYGAVSTMFGSEHRIAGRARLREGERERGSERAKETRRQGEKQRNSERNSERSSESLPADSIGISIGETCRSDRLPHRARNTRTVHPLAPCLARSTWDTPTASHQ